ncbi:hypothetical protein SDC9_187412 [bioreactor metagenome]|uniref:Uncharacterized protein n=1 Tax=bioreactor metagenome TaxID=1076179 RepID=A0A645HLI6_9ZZZZ
MHELLAKVVVNTEYFLVGECFLKYFIIPQCTFQIETEWLFHHDFLCERAHAIQRCINFLDLVDGILVQRGLQRQIVDELYLFTSIDHASQLLGENGNGLGFGHVIVQIIQIIGEGGGS